MYMAHVCFYVPGSDCVRAGGDCVRVGGNVCCVAGVVKDSGFLSLGVMKYIVCLCRVCDGCCVVSLNCKTWSCRCSCMGSMSVLVYICCMFVSCVHPVAVINAVFYITCSLFFLSRVQEATIWNMHSSVPDS